MISRKILNAGVLTLSLLVTTGIAADHEGAVIQAYYDKANTGAYHFEKKLKPSVINKDSFGLLYTRELDGRPSQPLYVPNLAIGGKVRNVMFVGTGNNSLYAFDADDPAASTPLWMRNFGPPNPFFVGQNGTPAIDLATKTLYFLHRTAHPSTSDTMRRRFRFWLNAVDIITGQDRPGSPQLLEDQQPGTGSGNVAGVMDFQNMNQKQNSGVLLHDGIVYTAFCGQGDNEPWHGYIFAHRMDTLQKVAAWISTPQNGGTMGWQAGSWQNVGNAGGGGIWQSGTALSADSQGNIYAVTGNGPYSQDAEGKPINMAMSVVKLKLNGNQFQVVDWFTPHNWLDWNMVDADMSTAAMLVPDSNLLIFGRKGGEVLGPRQAGLYVMSRNNMGHHRAEADEVAQTVVASDPDGTVDPGNTRRKNFVPNSPIYWDGPTGKVVFTWATGDFLRVWRVTATGLSQEPIGRGQLLETHPQASPSNGMVLTQDGANTDTAILWATTTNVETTTPLVRPIVARAYDAGTLTEIWNSEMNARDAAGRLNGLVNPIVAGGKLFISAVPASGPGRVSVYGFRRPPVADAGADQTISCLIPGQSTTVTLDGSGSSDPDGDPLTYEWKDEGGNVIATTAETTVSVLLGTNRTFTLTVTDNQGLSSLAPVTVTTDTTPPTLATKAPASLWPPNNKMHAFSVTTDVVQSASDGCDAGVNASKVRLVSISADEGTPSDVQISSLTAFSVRSKRNGNGDGRVYTIVVSVTDAGENTSTASWQIKVPHDQGNGGGAIAGPPVYTVTP
jgi:hypothetical protein